MTLVVSTNYWKAFNTTHFSILIKKVHTLNFSKRFVHWIFSYLRDWWHFAQIDLNIFNILYTNFGVPQAYILAPIPLNLCTAEMKSFLDGS